MTSLSNTLDPSVEAYLASVERNRYERDAPDIAVRFDGPPQSVDVMDLGIHGGSMQFRFGPRQTLTSFLDIDLARDLAAAINGVLARHAGYEPAAGTSLVYRHAAE